MPHYVEVTVKERPKILRGKLESVKVVALAMIFFTMFIGQTAARFDKWYAA